MIDLYYAADAERLENLDHAGRTRRSLQRHSCRHPRRRSVQAGVSGDQPEQPDSGDRGQRAARRRRAAAGVRDRRDPVLSRQQVQPFHTDRDARTHGHDPVGDVADERARADAGPAWPLCVLCAGKNSLRDPALPRRSGAALSRARCAVGEDRRLCRGRRIHHRRYRLLPLDHDSQGAGLYARRLSQRQVLVCRGACAAAGAGGGSRSANSSRSRSTRKRARTCSASAPRK